MLTTGDSKNSLAKYGSIYIYQISRLGLCLNHLPAEQ